MLRRSTDPPLLHIYGQGCPHYPVTIIGNRAGLLRLRQAVNRALHRNGMTVHDGDVFAADGEGYYVAVACDRRPWRSEAWQKHHAPPYAPEASPAPSNPSPDAEGSG